MSSAQGVFKKLIVAKQLNWETKALPAATSYELRSVTGEFNLEKTAYQSAERRTSQQMADSRHGTRRATGTLNGELSPDAYEDFFAAALRKNFAAGATVVGVTGDITPTGPQVTAAAATFITSGLRAGDVVLISGATNPLNNVAALIVSLTETTLNLIQLADKDLLFVAETGATLTFTAQGKKTFTPQTGHTDDAFSIEELYPDTVAPISILYHGMQVNNIDVAVQPDSMVTVTAGFLGKDADPPAAAPYFTAPAAQSTQGTLSSADGIAVVNGMATCRITSLNLSINGNITQQSAVFCAGIGGKSRGKMMATGSMTVFLDDATYLNYFDQETEIAVTYVLRTVDNKAIVFHIPRLKINSSTRNDGETNILITANFDCLEYVGTDLGVEKTTLTVLDTSLV